MITLIKKSIVTMIAFSSMTTVFAQLELVTDPHEAIPQLEAKKDEPKNPLYQIEAAQTQAGFYMPPRFEGGIVGLQQYINEQLIYPELAWAYGLEGFVVAQISIDSTGKISDVELLERLGLGCDQAVLELVEQMPAWVPGTRDGVAIASTIRIPIRFSIDESILAKS